MIKRAIEPIARLSFLWDMFQNIFGTNELKKKVLSEHFSRPGRILEIGCATGNIAEVFKEFDYTGVDTDCRLIERAKKKFPQRDYKFYCADVLSGFLPAEFYDYVLLSHTAHHLPDEYFRKIIDFSYSVLKPKGCFMIFDMIKPAPTDSYGKKFYYGLDRGEYIRNIDDFKAFFEMDTLFEKPEIYIVKSKKLFIDIIDQCLIRVQKR